MSRRHMDWLRQARRDVKAARDSAEAENYEWACFQSQQAAEKAVKAFLRYHHQEPRGHTLVQLVADMRPFATLPQELDATARELDRHYIQPRYPNGFASGHPGQYYDRQDALSAIGKADTVIRFVEDHVGELPTS